MITKVKGGTILIRPDNRFNFIEMKEDLFYEGLRGLRGSLLSIHCGLDILSPQERLLVYLLREYGVTAEDILKA